MKTRTRILPAAFSVAAFALWNPPAEAAPPRLLPFQGRLTGASGTPVPDGAKVVQFKIYDAPTGGTAVWNGEVQKVTVNGGLVSTLLGSKADLSQVDFNQAIYLEITVDANTDNQITAADPPLLPRQSILPAVFAVEASQITVRNPAGERVAGAGWEAVFDNGNPATGKIPGAKLADATVTTVQLAANAVTVTQLAPNAVTNAQVAPNAVTSDKIADGSITAADLAASLQADSIAPPGSVTAFAGHAIPTGWLRCDGSALKSTDYPRLYSAIGQNWGNGTQAGNAARYPVIVGQTNFNLPDMRGVFLRGVSEYRNDAFADDEASNTNPVNRIRVFAGGNEGNQVGSFQGDQLRSHSHSINYHQRGAGVGGLKTIGPTPGELNPGIQNDSIIATGGIETRPKNAYVHYIIKF